MGLNDEKQGLFVTEMARIVKALAERVDTQQIMAVQAVVEMRQAVSVLNKAATECKALKSAVATNIDTTIQTAMSCAGAMAATILAEKFEAANRYAVEAADRYESAARTIGWRVAAVIALACLAVLGASIYLVQGSFASLAEVHALRAEKMQLQEAIASLHGRGARSISTCTNQKNSPLPCAYVLTDERTGKGQWLLLATPK